jgi:hypothetical protein
MNNRKAAQEYLIKSITKIDKDNGNKYKDIFNKMTDKQFDDYMLALKNGESNVFIIMPNLEKNLTNDEIVKLAEDLDVKLYERIKYINDETGQEYFKERKYLILRLPVRRMKQYLLKKLQVPTSDKRVNKITGQLMADDKAAKLSFMETGFLATRGLSTSLLELLKLRGGDLTNYHQFKKNIELGDNSLNSLDMKESHPKIVKVLESIFRAMHLDVNMTNN